MGQALMREQGPGRTTDEVLRGLLGLLLLALNAGFYVEFPLARALGWSFLTSEDWSVQWRQYLLLVGLGFFLVGLLRGRFPWKAWTAARLSVEAGLIGILPIIVASIGIGVFSGGLDGVTYLADGILLAPALGGSEILVAVVGVQAGRLIGSRFLSRRSGTE